MTARKSIRSSSLQHSQNDNQSQISAVLSSDSYIDSNDEDQPLWHDNFGRHSVNIRASSRFSLARNQTAVLDPNSEPESTPLRRSWWKDVDNTEDNQNRQSNVSGKETKVPERSNLEVSDVSSIDEGIQKQRSKLRVNKRKSLQKDIFTKILESAENSILSKKASQPDENEDRPELSLSQSTPENEGSIRKIRRLAFKKRKNQLKLGAENILPQSVGNSADVFKTVLDISQSIEDDNDQASVIQKPPGALEHQHAASAGNLKDTETVAADHQIDELSKSANASFSEDSPVKSQTPQSSSRRKKRTIFTQKNRRRTPNFAALLSDQSNDGDIADQLPVTVELASNRNKSDKVLDNVIPESQPAVSEEDTLEEPLSPILPSLRKKRTKFLKTSKRRPSNFDALLNNISEDEDIAEKSDQVEANEPRNPQYSPVKEDTPKKSQTPDLQPGSAKRTSLRINKKKTRNFTALLSDQSIDEDIADQHLITAELTSHLNTSDKEHVHVITELQPPTSKVGSFKELQIPQTPQTSPSKKRTTFSGTNKNKTRNSSASLSNQNTDEDVPDQPPIGQELDSTQNKATKERTLQTSPENGPARNMAAEKKDVHSEGSIQKKKNDHFGDQRRSQPEEMLVQYLNTSNSSLHTLPANLSEKSAQLMRLSTNTLLKASVRETRSVSEAHANVSNENVSLPPVINLSKSLKKSHKSSPTKNSSNRRSLQTLLEFASEHEDDDNFISDRNSPGVSGVVDKSQKALKQFENSKSHQQDVTSGGRITSQIPSDLVNAVDSPQESLIAQRKSREMQTVENEYVSDSEKELNKVRSNISRSLKKNGKDNTSVQNSLLKIMDDRDASHDRTSSTYSNSESVPQTSDAKRISQIRAALEQVKKREIAVMKSTKISSYFAPVPRIRAEKATESTKGVTGVNKTTQVKRKPPAQVDKAYLVNGKAYKRPKLTRPKPWVTDRLYKFLWKKMEPKYGLRTRVRSEKFISDLIYVFEIVVRRKKYDNYKQELEHLMREMARLDVIKTRDDFYIFCQEFLPYEFRIKAVPMLLPGCEKNIPYDPAELHKPILQ